MLQRIYLEFFVLFICLHVYLNLTNACELDQTHHGCRIDNGACACAYGCKSDYRYATKKECQDALKGRANDICGRTPCLNGGTCIQVSQMPGYRCRCEGTGYWGNRCQRLCPTPEEHAHSARYPYECVVI